AGGVGAPAEVTLTAEQNFVYAIVQWTDEFFYVLGVGLIKVSILLYYRRVFITRIFQIVVTCTIAFVGAWMIAFLLVSIFQANPISWNWTGVGQVINLNILFLTEVGTDIFLDTFILCLPMPIISRLHMSTEKKFIVCGILALGFFCTIASCVRLWYFTQFVSLELSGSSNLQEINNNMLIWSFIEPSASVVCACLPTMGPLFRGGRSAASLVDGIKSVFSRKDGNSLARKGSSESSSSSHIVYEERIAIPKNAYLDSNAGFTNIESVQHEKMDVKQQGVITVKTTLNSRIHKENSSYV
ncbi:MAG: hypothetical protein MMC33_008731, partial [Icmadophila ericetorum]|nr:hypothetical protein [Icmadophila ericetorum]